MAVSNKIEFTSLDNLYLDPQNPRLGRRATSEKLSQKEILSEMRDWTLDEIALSYIESDGFWIQEALLVVEEELDGEDCLVVVEGNRRLAALMYLHDTLKDEKRYLDSVPRKWKNIFKGQEAPLKLFSEIPYILVDERSDIAAFLGFRHVTGIKQWKTTEKAEYISSLIDDYGYTYEQVRKKIGSLLPTVRQNYAAYRIFRQIEDTVENVPIDRVEKRFSVLYLSLRTKGVQNYLHVEVNAPPERLKTPIPQEHEDALINFARWLFGTEEEEPLFGDSRRVDDFGKILESEEAVAYLVNNIKPNFDVAYQKAGGEKQEALQALQNSASLLTSVFQTVNRNKQDDAVKSAVKELFVEFAPFVGIFQQMATEELGLSQKN